MPSATREPERPPTLAQSALRWGLALAVGLGGAWAARRAFGAYRARATARLIATDYAQFAGCLFAQSPAPAGAEAARDRVRALSLGRGDPLWPHSCSRALTRLTNDALVASDDDPRDRALVDAAHAAESALGRAVFWQRHVEQGRRGEDPAWLAPVLSLRTEVSASLARRASALRLEEVPRDARAARRADEPEPPPQPVPLPMGREADLVDLFVSSTHEAVLMRDVRSRYGLCVRRVDEAFLRCGPLALGPNADPEGAVFVSGDGAPRVLVRERPPSSRRLVLHEGETPPFALDEDPSPLHDVLALLGGSVVALAPQGSDGLALVTEPTRARRELNISPPPRREERVLFMHEGQVDVAYVASPRGGGLTLSIATTAGTTSESIVSSGESQGIRACIVDAQGSWLVFGTNRTLYAEAKTRTESSGTPRAGAARAPRRGSLVDAAPLDRYALRCAHDALLACASGAVCSLCEAALGCRAIATPALMVDRAHDVLLLDANTVLYADTVGTPPRPRLRRISLVDGAARDVPFAAEPPIARRVRLGRVGERVLLASSGDESFLWRADGEGALTAAMVEPDEAYPANAANAANDAPNGTGPSERDRDSGARVPPRR